MAQDPRTTDAPVEGTPTVEPTDERSVAAASDTTGLPVEEASAPPVEEASAPPVLARGEPGMSATRRNLPTDAEMIESTLADKNLLVVMRGVSRSFDDRRVVDQIDLTVPRGTILGIIGPSGAGKTTTIRMLTGALTPTSGDIRVLGVEPRRFRRRDRERIGYMPQQFALYEELTAGENVDFVASLFGMLWRRRRRRVQEVLKTVDLWDARKRQAGKLSGGMQRRLELACALVHEPTLIILDEPTAGIDPLLRGSIWDELHRLRDAGQTLLVTTQHISEAEECDAVALIVGGRIVAIASPDQLRRMATNGDLLDIVTATMFDGTNLTGTPGVVHVRQDGPRHLRVVVDDAGTALPVVVDRIRSGGTDVESAREERLSFDEIFAILVERHQEALAAEQAGVDRTGDSGARDGSEAA
ncbi:MAG: type transport system ATP-binding protein [Chloroflexota bacterium]|jgi:ABC-2 type transport system ATP-binding protein|nr:type transport system ATP-binding protein [Chloroflexota bacterium]